jgi:UDP-N-acetylglucosamine 2-epimerase
MTQEHKILTVVGARPQFVKAAVISRRLREMGDAAPFREVLVHTGQHYDAAMSDVFFRELAIPDPGYHLGVGSAPSHVQIGAMVQALGEVLATERPDALLVYGDTHSTLSAAVAAVHAGVPVVHVEAGERIYRRRDVPEEVNRVLCDHAASLCLAITRRGERYLRREGMSPRRVRFVGDPMLDLFEWGRERVHRYATVSPETFGLTVGGYALATLHRAQNTVSREVLTSLLETLDRAPVPVLLAMHPRVRDLLARWGWTPSGSLRLTEPMGYFDFLRMLLDCAMCVTDSGGVSREAYFARKLSIVPMENCWWPEVVESGWAVEAGTSPERILEAMTSVPAPETYQEGLFGDADSATHIIAAVGELVRSGRRDGVWHRRGAFPELPPHTPTRFTIAEYRRLVSRLQRRGYEFLPFGQAAAASAAGKPFVLMRHDIDFDLQAALRVAQVEAEQGVASTFFFMVRTEHYSVFSARGSETVRRILDLGHHLGLHFDPAAYGPDATKAELAAAVGREAAMLSAWFGQDVEIVSFHRPAPGVVAGDREISAPLPNTYLPEFCRDMAYYSDSRGRWGHGEPTGTEAFERGQPLQILTHPLWWNEMATTPFEVLMQFVDDRTVALDDSAGANCEVYRTTPVLVEPS